jgi:hypothetical protein
MGAQIINVNRRQIILIGLNEWHFYNELKLGLYDQDGFIPF